MCALAGVLASTAGWVYVRFGAVAPDQVLLNLPSHGGEGVGNSSLVAEAAVVCLGLPLAGLVLAWLALRVPGPSPRRRPPRRRVAVLPIAAFTVSLTALLTVTGVPQYAAAMLGNGSVAPYYVTPVVDSAPDRPRNLITIYLKSIENTYRDPALFGQNLLATLDEATVGWTSSEGLRQYPGGGWTMAGLVGTQCGVPLKSRLLLPGVNPNEFGEQVDSYLPGAVCLGDVLAAHGYTSVFVGGAHARFAGKDTFLSGHGYDEVLGLSDWEADGEDRSDISVWGLSDDRLLARARGVLADLDEGDEPFNLTILTLDTHEPGGVYPSCATADELAMVTAVRCSMRAVAGFLDHLEDEGYLDDTVVVVMGDHLKATSEGGFFKEELERTRDRTIVFRVWSPDPVTVTRPTTDQFSVLPTTLELLGFGLPDGRAGLGVSFVGQHPLDGTALQLSELQYHSAVAAPSAELYRQLLAGSRRADGRRAGVRGAADVSRRRYNRPRVDQSVTNIDRARL